MQRLLSMFPPGAPGVGLLILRGSVTVALLSEHYAHRGALSTVILIMVVLVSLAISLGYLTPIAAVAVVSLHGWIWLQLGSAGNGALAIACIDAGALALLGPGAYSIDGYRFGRRIVVLPPS